MPTYFTQPIDLLHNINYAINWAIVMDDHQQFKTNNYIILFDLMIDACQKSSRNHHF